MSQPASPTPPVAPERCERYRLEFVETAAALFALGALDDAERAEFARHLDDGCDACTTEVQRQREVVAVVDRAAPAVVPSAGLRARLLARVRAEASETAAKQAAGEAGSGVQVWKHWQAPPTVVDGFYVVHDGEGEWESAACAGVRFKKLAVDAERRYVTMLVRMDAGASYPAHRHGGCEECFVLEGDLHVAGEVLGAGDYQYAGADSLHGEQRTEGGCLLLIVSSQDDELR